MFVFDLDGTLFNSHKIISERSKRSLRGLSKTGEKIVIATARPPRSVIHKIEDLQVECDVIYYNGAMTRFFDGTVLNYEISYKVLGEIYSYCRLNDRGAVVSVEVNDGWYSASRFDFLRFYSVSDGPTRVSESDLVQMSPHKILINNYTKSNEILQFCNERANAIETDGSSLIQIMASCASKENAVKDISERYGISRDRIYCFGDDYNDVGLFNFCGNSVAMGNAIPELKGIAKYQTETNDNDGVSQFIDTVFLKKDDVSYGNS